MKRFLSLISVIAFILLIGVNFSYAAFFVDSAPNAYGSPNYASWWATAKADVAAGTFVNMRNGTFPGTLMMTPSDETVYSFGDLGKRLHWIYYMPNTTTTNLASNFEVKWTIDWAGENWTVDSANNWVLDTPIEGWSQPASWEDNPNGGVIGTFGFAWWGAYYTNTPAELALDLLSEGANQTFALGQMRYRVNNNSAWQYENLQVNMVPEPASMILLGLGLAGIAARKLRRG